MMEIRAGDLGDAQVLDLLMRHAASARAATARGSAHALDPHALAAPDIALWTVWDGDTLLAIGALRRLSTTLGEVKAMHTAGTARRTGAGGLLLRHLIAQGRAAGLERLALETGSWPYFDGARAFYAAHGFVPCQPFGDYRADPNSVFLALDLT